MVSSVHVLSCVSPCEHGLPFCSSRTEPHLLTVPTTGLGTGRVPAQDLLLPPSRLPPLHPACLLTVAASSLGSESETGAPSHYPPPLPSTDRAPPATYCVTTAKVCCGHGQTALIPLEPSGHIWPRFQDSGKRRGNGRNGGLGGVWRWHTVRAGDV